MMSFFETSGSQEAHMNAPIVPWRRERRHVSVAAILAAKEAEDPCHPLCYACMGKARMVEARVLDNLTRRFEKNLLGGRRQ